MSLQLPAILSPPTSCIPALALTVSCRRSGCRSRLAPSRVGFRFWASPFPSRLANASGRIVFNMVLFMDWQFVSGCSPPRLSTTQLPSTTDSQCSVRWGLSPHCWCALSGALGQVAPRPPTCPPKPQSTAHSGLIQKILNFFEKPSKALNPTVEIR